MHADLRGSHSWTPRDGRALYELHASDGPDGRPIGARTLPTTPVRHRHRRPNVNRQRSASSSALRGRGRGGSRRLGREPRHRDQRHTHRTRRHASSRRPRGGRQTSHRRYPHRRSLRGRSSRWDPPGVSHLDVPDGIEQNTEPPLPFVETLSCVSAGTELSLVSQLGTTGTVTCAIVADGAVISSNRSRGAFAVVSCSALAA